MTYRPRRGERADSTRERLTYRIKRLAAAGWIPVAWSEADQAYVAADPAECYRVKCPHCDLTYDHSQAGYREKHLVTKHGYEPLAGWKKANAI